MQMIILDFHLELPLTPGTLRLITGKKKFFWLITGNIFKELHK